MLKMTYAKLDFTSDTGLHKDIVKQTVNMRNIVIKIM